MSSGSLLQQSQNPDKPSAAPMHRKLYCDRSGSIFPDRAFLPGQPNLPPWKVNLWKRYYVHGNLLLLLCQAIQTSCSPFINKVNSYYTQFTGKCIFIRNMKRKREEKVPFRGHLRNGDGYSGTVPFWGNHPVQKSGGFRVQRNPPDNLFVIPTYFGTTEQAVRTDICCHRCRRNTIQVFHLFHHRKSIPQHHSKAHRQDLSEPSLSGHHPSGRR